MIAAILAFALAHVAWLMPLLGGGGVLGWLVRAPLRRLVGKASRHRSWLLLLTVAAAGAALYAWGASGRADRARLIAWGEMACASAGAELQPDTGPRGKACAGAVAELARFKRDADASTAKLLLDRLGQRETKMAADARSARRSADAARAANTRMEAADAAIGTDDRVGGDWIAAFNNLAGLRRP